MTARNFGVAIIGIGFALACAQVGDAQTSTSRPINLSPLPVERIQVAPIEDSEGAFRGLPKTATRVSGMVLTSDGAPAGPVGHVVLRNLSNGEAGAPVAIDAGSRFDVSDVTPGTYAAEVSDGQGRVLAVTSAFSLAAGDAVTLMVVIPDRRVRSFWYWGQSAVAAVLNAAAGAGILAETPGPPVTPRQ
jgi:hypothetical protein